MVALVREVFILFKKLKEKGNKIKRKKAEKKEKRRKNRIHCIKREPQGLTWGCYILLLALCMWPGRAVDDGPYSHVGDPEGAPDSWL